MPRLLLYLCISIIGTCRILSAQLIDSIQIPTRAKENPKVQFHYREPVNYDITSTSKSRLLIYFGGRNTDGFKEIDNPSWGAWCDKNGLFLIVPSYKNDNYWEPQKWSGKELLDAIAQLKKKYPQYQILITKRKTANALAVFL